MDFAEPEKVQRKATEVTGSLGTLSSARRGEILGWFPVPFTEEILFPTTSTNYISTTLDSSWDCNHSILPFEIFDLLLHGPTSAVEHTKIFHNLQCVRVRFWQLILDLTAQWLMIAGCWVRQIQPSLLVLSSSERNK